MALVNVAFLSPFNLSGTVVPNVASGVLTENLTSGTTSVASTQTGSSGQLLRITATGNIYVAFGVNPTATPANGILVQTGQSEYFAIDRTHKVAVIDA